MRNRHSIDLYVALTYIFSCSNINPVGIRCIGLLCIGILVRGYKCWFTCVCLFVGAIIMLALMMSTVALTAA